MEEGIFLMEQKVFIGTAKGYYTPEACLEIKNLFPTNASCPDSSNKSYIP
jgi:hypothetical protein